MTSKSTSDKESLRASMSGSRGAVKDGPVRRKNPVRDCLEPTRGVKGKIGRKKEIIKCDVRVP